MILVQVLLATLAVLLILLFVLPFEVAGQGEWGLKKAYLIRINWTGRLVVFSMEAQQGVQYPMLTIFGVTLWRGRGNGEKKKLEESRKLKKKDAKRDKSGFSLLEAKRMMTDHSLVGAFKSFLGRIIKALRLEFRAWGTYSTDDPALTGVITGFLAAINSDKIVLDLEPDFVGDDLDIKGSLSSRFIIAELIVICLTFLWQKQVRYYWLPIIKAKFKFKEVTQHV